MFCIWGREGKNATPFQPPYAGKISASLSGYFTPGQNVPGTQWTGGWRGFQVRYWRLGEEKKLVPLLGNKSWFAICLARSLNTVPATLSQLRVHFFNCNLYETFRA